MSTGFSYQNALGKFKVAIQNDVTTGDGESINCLISAYQSLPATEPDKRTAADQALRNIVANLIQELIHNKRTDENVVPDVLNIITLTVSAAKQGMCSASLPFSLLGDVLDCLTLDLCDPVFCYVEERVATWKSPQFYTAGKNFLLRMCNDLLRRLSQAQNTVFCGRIQLFLARLFPLSEKSALNLFSQFNSDNVTVFNTKPVKSMLDKTSTISAKKDVGVSSDLPIAKKDELLLDVGVTEMEVDQGDADSSKNIEEKATEKSLIVDFELYSSIWSLQDIFRSPAQCYVQDIWDKFTNNADSVFRVFSSFKLDKQHFSEEHPHKAYFAKFLTSEKLTNLQLNDTMFRRQLLCQFLVLFQYLSGTVKFKASTAILSDKQTEWINQARAKIFALLEETPPNGKHFASYVKHLLEREEYWITWKNEGCASFIKTKKPEEARSEESKMSSQSPPAKRRKTGDVTKTKRSTIADDFIAGKPLGMGSPELTRLWELCPDNLAACMSEKRSFLPTLEGFFAEGIELMDPKNMVEEEYMSYNDPNFQWRALRLLSQRSPLFFASQPAQMQFKVVSQYLKGVMKKLSEEFPQNVPESTEIVQENGDVDKSLEEDQQEDEKEGGEDLDDAEDEDDDDEVLEDDQFENDDALLNEDSQQEDGESDDDAILESTAPSDALSSDQVTAVAQKIGKNWEKLAPHLGLNSKDVSEIKEDSEDVILQARQTLVTWQDRKRAEAKRPALVQALVKADMNDLANEIS